MIRRIFLLFFIITCLLCLSSDVYAGPKQNFGPRCRKSENQTKNIEATFAPRPVNLKIGEKLFYSVSWLGINVGTVEVAVKKSEKIQGKEVVVVEATTSSSKWLKSLYRIKYWMQSCIETNSGNSLACNSLSIENKHYREEYTSIDYDKKKVFYKYKNGKDKPFKTKEAVVSTPMQDPLSMLYTLRYINPKVKKNIHYKIQSGDENYKVDLKVKNISEIYTPAGKFKTFKIKPGQKTIGFLSKKGYKGTVWIDTESKVIVKILLKTNFIGSLIAKLEKFENSDVKPIMKTKKG